MNARRETVADRLALEEKRDVPPGPNVKYNNDEEFSDIDMVSASEEEEEEDHSKKKHAKKNKNKIDLEETLLNSGSVD
jgi:hypothetical protein